MLILTRYLQEACWIGGARVTVLGVTGEKHGRVRVTLGIEAPPDMHILRAELPRLACPGGICQGSCAHHSPPCASRSECPTE